MDRENLSGKEGYNLKFKRETLLNYGMNRWGLNKASSAGPTSELIRACAPSKYKEWVNYYFKNAIQKKKKGQHITKEYIKSLGETLYIKLSEVVQYEIEQITEKECTDYVYNLVLNRTFEGYQTEIKTIYGQLENKIGRRIETAPDDWDRKYSVDFYVRVKNNYIGIQIKPILSGIALNQYQWNKINIINHRNFERKYGGKVFFVFSTKSSGGKKEIYNTGVIKEIIREIKRLDRVK